MCVRSCLSGCCGCFLRLSQHGFLEKQSKTARRVGCCTIVPCPSIAGRVRHSLSLVCERERQARVSMAVLRVGKEVLGGRAGQDWIGQDERGDKRLLRPCPFVLWFVCSPRPWTLETLRTEVWLISPFCDRDIMYGVCQLLNGLPFLLALLRVLPLLLLPFRRRQGRFAMILTCQWGTTHAKTMPPPFPIKSNPSVEPR